MIEKMINNYEYTSLRTIIPYPKSPYKMYIKNKNKVGVSLYRAKKWMV